MSNEKYGTLSIYNLSRKNLFTIFWPKPGLFCFQIAKLKRASKWINFSPSPKLDGQDSVVHQISRSFGWQTIHSRISNNNNKTITTSFGWQTIHSRISNNHKTIMTRHFYSSQFLLTQHIRHCQIFILTVN